jgi:glucose/mannose-6-phosphate isomerase
MSKEITLSLIQDLDSQNMFEIIKKFPGQVQEAVEIGKNSAGFSDQLISDDFYILGIGGSAIGGDILRTYLQSVKGAEHLRINVNRNYTLPGFINDKTNIIASSYSGETEETIISLTEAIKFTKNIACISTGGTIEKIAKTNDFPLIKIPAGYQPRAALGYSFFTMLQLMLKSASIKEEGKKTIDLSIKETIENLRSKSIIFSDINNPENTAKILAEKLFGTIPVIYSTVDRLEAVNLRWRGQIQENAKNLAFGSILPEMNHNEINGWTFPDSLTKNFSIIYLPDEEDHPRNKMRFDALSSIIETKVNQIISIKGEGKYLLTRIFDLIYFADWVSYYLAILNNIDPTPIPYITKLKNFLAGK